MQLLVRDKAKENFVSASDSEVEDIRMLRYLWPSLVSVEGRSIRKAMKTLRLILLEACEGRENLATFKKELLDCNCANIKDFRDLCYKWRFKVPDNEYKNIKITDFIEIVRRCFYVCSYDCQMKKESDLELKV